MGRFTEAACRNLSDEDREMYFPSTKGRPAKHPEYEELCGSCPIKYFCLSYAIVHDEEGIWGGQTKSQRDRLPGIIRDSLLQEAKAQGWYEVRPSVDEILRRHLPEPVDPFEVAEPATVLQNYVTSLLLPEESQLEPPRPIVQQETCEDSKEYQSQQIAS